jgi:hypothetical protein
MRCTRHISLAVLLAGTACCLLTACGSEDQQQQPSEISGVSLAPGEEIKEGPPYVVPSMDTLQGKPQPFPAHYPLKRYPNSHVTFAWVTPNVKPGIKNQVVLQTVDRPLVVGAYYKADLVRDGWQLVSTFDNTSYSGSRWRKGDQEAEVRVSEDPYGKQAIQLMVGPILKPMRPIGQVPVPQPPKSGAGSPPVQRPN